MLSRLEEGLIMQGKALTAILLNALLLGTTACSSQVLKQADNVGKEGNDYVTAVVTATENAGAYIIDYDSKRLIEQRELMKNASPETVNAELVTADQDISQIMIGLKDVKASASLLSRFFILLNKSATDTTAYTDNLKTQTGDLITQINGLTASDGNATASPLISDNRATGIASLASALGKSFRAKAIQDFIQTTAIPVSHLLAFNHEKLQLMQTSYKTRQAADAGEMRNQVTNDFIDNKIGPEWSENRKKLFIQNANKTVVDDVLQQSAKLQNDWDDLVAGKTNLDSFTADLADFNDTLAAFNKAID